MKILFTMLFLSGILLTFGVGNVWAQASHKSCRNLGLFDAEIGGSYPASPDWATTFAAQNPGAVGNVNEEIQDNPDFCIQR